MPEHLVVYYKILKLKGGEYMKKRRLTLTVLLLLILSVQVHCAYYAVSATPNLSFSGTTANCTGRVTTGNEDDSIVATLTLWHGNTFVYSWSGSGTDYVYLSGSCTVSKGETYTLTIDATVNGVSIPQKSISRTC